MPRQVELGSRDYYKVYLDSADCEKHGSLLLKGKKILLPLSQGPLACD
jgi:hypothetical protein